VLLLFVAAAAAKVAAVMLSSLSSSCEVLCCYAANVRLSLSSFNNYSSARSGTSSLVPAAAVPAAAVVSAAAVVVAAVAVVVAVVLKLTPASRRKLSAAFSSPAKVLSIQRNQRKQYITSACVLAA
jgi:hypothetical protein